MRILKMHAFDSTFQGIFLGLVHSFDIISDFSAEKCKHFLSKRAENQWEY